jgi:predicted nuclease of predicted toxin-antitoxin system
MKFLLDQGLPRGTAPLLREGGDDAVHTSEIGLARADDEFILAHGLAEGRVVVTLDADFHVLLALSGATRPSVIRIRIQGLRAEDVVSVLRGVIDQCGPDIEEGSAVSVTENSIRVRKLPLIR